MIGYAEGFSDTSIDYCPYCGEPVGSYNGNGMWNCEHCGNKFYVIEGDED